MLIKKRIHHSYFIFKHNLKVHAFLNKCIKTHINKYINNLIKFEKVCKENFQKLPTEILQSLFCIHRILDFFFKPNIL
jgi:hypothetical protein